jgi:hypothetical protein
MRFIFGGDLLLLRFFDESFRKKLGKNEVGEK